jgi:hypothetical protein
MLLTISLISSLLLSVSVCAVTFVINCVYRLPLAFILSKKRQATRDDDVRQRDGIAMCLNNNCQLHGHRSFKHTQKTHKAACDTYNELPLVNLAAVAFKKS